MAAQAIGNVPEAQTKMEGILAILQKQLEKIQSQFDTHAPNLLDDDEWKKLYMIGMRDRFWKET